MTINPERIVVEGWDPAFAAPFEPDGEMAAPKVDLDVELPEAAWRTRPVPEGTPAREILFLDGVQRVDARVTLVDATTAVSGMAGSFAAGLLRHTPGRAVLETVDVRRGLFTQASDVALDCGGGVRYAPYATTDTSGQTLVRAMTEQMRSLEKLLATDADAELVVLDGPLSGGRPIPGAVGMVKTHRRMYLPEPLQHLVGELRDGERTPLFLTVTSFSRWSWYLRLPGPRAHPWAGVVRCEASGDLPVGAARELADATQLTLPRFASTPHRDSRAPQNLTPIGELERLLRHRLGDAAVLERRLRRMCAAWRP